MGKIIKKYTAYAAWDYEKEVEDLNQLSAEGMQLIKGGCFCSQYEEDKSVQYRYQLDYNRNIDNRMRYIESFREQGWEYINSTFNGWHYFRKPYNASLPESEYEIYTDLPSRSEMAGRWMKLGYTITALVLLLCLLTIYQLIRRPELYRIGFLVEYLVLGSMLVYGLRGMNLAVQGKERTQNRRFPITLVIILVILSLFWSLLWIHAKDTMEGTWSGSVLNEAEYPGIKFDMKLPEFIYLTLENDCDLPATATITDESGTVIFTKTSNTSGLKKEKIFLSRGSYQLHIDYDTENRSEETTDFQIKVKIE